MRDQAHKQQLPQLFKHMLCLTVYEAKGLEFNDVIIYDFFDQSDASTRQWQLLASMATNEVDESDSDADIADLETLDADRAASGKKHD